MAQFKVKVKHMKKTLEWFYPLLVKLMDDADWREGDIPREWYQEVLDEDEIKAIGLVAYSPVLKDTDLEGAVPMDWPGSAFMVDGQYERQKRWTEYAPVSVVTGGYVIQFGKDAWDGGKVRLCDEEDFRRWAAEFNGFSTPSEVQEL